jgi:hypothetical protein
MSRDISNHDDIIESHDIIERIEELHTIAADETADTDERTHAHNELAVLQALQEEAEGYVPDWQHGAQLIRDTYFVEAMQELCEDIGDIPHHMPSYLVIDWDATASNLKQDYTSVDFDGVTYWVR